MDERLREVLAQEAEQPESWWWLSFADGSRPAGQQWLGGAFVQGRGLASAVLRAHMLHINPGGEVCAADLADVSDVDLPPMRLCNRLLQREDLAETPFALTEWPDGVSDDA